MPLFKINILTSTKSKRKKRSFSWRLIFIVAVIFSLAAWIASPMYQKINCLRTQVDEIKSQHSEEKTMHE
jgi:Tfp pilus assembly major pilin PilA